jgi:ureidoacrylate peracid hydrolase
MSNSGYALIVVDMQNGFCHPEGSFPRIGLGLEGAQAAVRNAAVAVEQARRAGIPVIFTRHLYRLGRADQGPTLIRNSPALAVNGLAAGSWDADVVEELDCRPDDLKVDKVRFDAFQWTSLELLLRGLDVTSVMVCGVVTNLCVETTVRSAFMRDLPVTLIEDCCAAKTRRLHELSVEVLSSYDIADIVSLGSGFDAGKPDAAAGRLLSPVRASDLIPPARLSDLDAVPDYTPSADFPPSADSASFADYASPGDHASSGVYASPEEYTPADDYAPSEDCAPVAG